jgi:hypothetical protein
MPTDIHLNLAHHLEMSHVANPEISWESLPNDIKEKIRLFHNQEELRNHLAKQLDEVQRAHAQLQRELAPYRDYLMLKKQKITRNVGCVVRSTQGGPICHCPEEVLHEIFQCYLIGYHPNIRILLLVCKDWYRIVMDRATLWTRIQIPKIPQDDNRTINTVVTPYVQACLKRSQNLPLDIELNLERLRGIDNYAISYLYETLVDNPDYNHMQNDFYRELYNMERPNVFNYSFLNLLNTNVERWQKFKIMVPSNDIDTCVALFREIDLPKAKLSSLEICGITDLRVPLSHLLRNLPSIQGVQHLNAGGISLAYFPDSDSLCSLQTLTTFPWGPTQILDISRCTSLQSLTLDISYTVAVPDVGKYHLHLPRLKSLSVKGPLQSLSEFTIECPVLEQLTMKSCENFRTSDPSKWLKPPRVLARRIYWEMESWNELMFIHGMEVIVSLWDRTELIKVSASNKHMTLHGTFDLQSKEASLQTQDSSPFRFRPAEERGATVVIKKWAEDNSFSFHDNSTSMMRPSGYVDLFSLL